MYAQKALETAKKAHEGQVDKAGKPYISHVLTVASFFEDDILQSIALLHDVIEDTDLTLEDLAACGFPREVLDALSLLTRQDGMEYMDYIQNIKTNPLAVQVKLADLTHNMDLSRLETVTQKDLDRVEKYKAAFRLLTGRKEEQNCSAFFMKCE